MNDSYRILGLDLGIGSVGFALIDFGTHEIVKVGVRLFDVPQTPKTKESYAKVRRVARSARRNTQRRADRLKHCLKLLKKFDLVPQDASKRDMQTRKGDKPVIKLRAKGVHLLLDDREFSQILYSLCSHRGYIPHGEDDGSADIEGKKVLSAISENRENVKNSGYLTVGQMIADRSDQRARNRADDYQLSVANKQIVDEVRTLFRMQQEFGNKKASEELLQQYIEVLSWQKIDPTYDDRIYATVGQCTYFDNQKRAARATLSFELCRAYETVGHCMIVYPDDRREHLSPDVRKRIIDSVFYGNKVEKVTYKKIRKWLDLDTDARFVGIALEDEAKEIIVAKTWKQWHLKIPGLMPRLKADRALADSIAEALTIASTEESVVQRLEKLPLNSSEIEMIAALPYNSRAYKGYGVRGLTALNMLIDAFEDYNNVCTLSEAEAQSGLYGYRTARDRYDRSLELPDFRLYDPTMKNPVVLRTMSQMRRVVNAIIKKYGLPNEIHVELAKELKQSRKEKALITARNKDTEKKREVGRKDIVQKLGYPEEEIQWGTMQYSMVSKLLKRYELWVEQEERCIYCGKNISFDSLVENLYGTEIDHIIPISRSADDSRMNKVLSCSACNQDKLNRIPREWFEDSNRDWEEFSTRVTRIRNFPFKKRERLLMQKYDEGEEQRFIQRNLNDTRYASRATKEYLEKYLDFPEGNSVMPVKAVAGGATALLRKQWGILKNRADNNLHHALDAAVIAAATQSHIMKVAHYSARKGFMSEEEKNKNLQLVEPWPGFAQQVVREVQRVYPTRLSDHKLSGAAFEDTIYRLIEYKKDYKAAVLRKPSGGEKVATNFMIDSTGGVRLLDGLAYINLWWNPKKIEDLDKDDKPGAYLIEPVYYADVPFVNRPDYVRRYVPSGNKSRVRAKWDPIPEELLSQIPVTIFRNDALLINGKLRRFSSIDISGNSWKLFSLRGDMEQREATKGVSLKSIKTQSGLTVIQEDILGDCYASFSEEEGQL
ncbi:type II CRISPR RNA-guided endonuclease Cas9 [Arcanobacterium phocae]|uniref:type II CRISPR RNA-guided endonuclease Cas9 n=1 Tax=Arcanobacterium phocae TaxID=131112 RepID=UPI001C0EC2FE|nr:type II CRISPR RNA-guided endonuclease Cas9 [Arcanobacterium phocae]